MNKTKLIIHEKFNGKKFLEDVFRKRLVSGWILSTPFLITSGVKHMEFMRVLFTTGSVSYVKPA